MKRLVQFMDEVTLLKAKHDWERNARMMGMPIGVYEHYKGQLYYVFGLAKQCDDDGWDVIYAAMYDSEFGVFTRDIGAFLQYVEVNGVAMPKYKKFEVGS